MDKVTSINTVVTDWKKKTDKFYLLESGSFDALIERVRYAVPELLELNNNKQNVVLATLEGLRQLKTPEEVARARGKSVGEILA